MNKGIEKLKRINQRTSGVYGMSQRTERLYDYKDRPIASVWNIADGGIQFDFDHEVSLLILSRDSTDRLLKLIMDDRRERGSYGSHVGSFGGDL